MQNLEQSFVPADKPYDSWMKWQVDSLAHGAKNCTDEQ